jgi:hypothetical protein
MINFYQNSLIKLFYFLLKPTADKVCLILMLYTVLITVVLQMKEKLN